MSAENDNAKSAGPNKRALTAAEKAEAKKLLGMLEDADTRAAFEDWIEKVGMTPEVLDKPRLVADGKDR